MFDNDVTKNYQLQDATFEILIMLAGAFLLGTLFCWALGKLRGNKRPPYQRKTVDHQNGYRQPAQQAGATYPDHDAESNTLKGRAGGAAGIIGSSIAATGSDSFSAGSSAMDKITDSGSSITDKISDAKSTITDKASSVGSSVKDSFSDTLDTAKDTLSDSNSFIKNKTPENIDDEKTVIFDASSSATNKASQLLDSTKEETEEAKASPPAINTDPLEATDNFKKIEGIGPKIETALHAAGIRTYADLRASDSETLKVILIAASPSFKTHDPETWPYQADLAYNNKWEKLKEYQDFLMGREESTTSEQKTQGLES